VQCDILLAVLRDIGGPTLYCEDYPSALHSYPEREGGVAENVMQRREFDVKGKRMTTSSKCGEDYSSMSPESLK